MSEDENCQSNSNEPAINTEDNTYSSDITLTISTDILSIKLYYFIKQFQAILTWVIRPCNVDIVMQKCGIMKEFQKIKIQQVQN